MRFPFAFILASLLFVTSLEAEFQSAVARRGQPKYDFSKQTHFSYRHPDAPKGGCIRIGTVGTFDSLNQFIVKGVCAEGMTYTFASLMRRSADEPYTLYAYIAEGIEIAPDFSKVTFKINPKATFHDGSPITSDDIEFTITLLKEKGWPRYRQFYGKIKRFIRHDERTFTLELSPDEEGNFDPELPMTLGIMIPLSKKQLEGKDFLSLGMTAPMGSGPYKVKMVEPGRRIVYERVKNHWAEDLPINRGSSNFDEVEVIYTKNAIAHFQEFLSGGMDIFFETNPNQWNTAYDVPSVKKGDIQRISFEHRRPVTVKTLIFNMRRPVFQDLRLRQALSYAFDFETLNKMVFFGDLKRVKSLFANTPLAHTAPATAFERKILEPHMHLIEKQIKEGILPKDVLDTPYIPPSTEGDGNQRENFEKANTLLNEAGWKIDPKGQRVNKKGEVLTLELLLKDPKLEKIAVAFQRSLKMLGITLKIRQVDTVQYESRMASRDFEMAVHSWGNSLSPGVEQPYYFSRDTADREGSSNYIGVKDELIEALAKDLAKANTQEELEAYVHNLDRFVMHKAYFIPLDYNNITMVAYHKDKITFPKHDPSVGVNVVDTAYAMRPSKTEEKSDSIWAWIKGFFYR